MNGVKSLFFVALAALQSSLHACDFAIPFTHEFQNNVSASMNDVGPCVLTVSTTTSSRTTAAAFLHYRRGTPLTSVRYGFRLDTSALSNANTLAFVQVFGATSANIVALPFPSSNVLSIVLRADAPTSELRFNASDANGTEEAVATLNASVNTIRVEINVSTTGSVKYWINHDFVDPPDGVIEHTLGGGIDNSAFAGVIGAEIGLSNPLANFVLANSLQPLVFDQFESSDDLLFYDDFSSGAQ